jgi:uncharacterized damage-inducible protein DinB
VSDTPWEPPIAGTEEAHVIGSLDRLRTTFRWKADGLDAAGLNTRIGASTLTLGALLKHLALVEDHCFSVRLTGAPFPDVPSVAGHDGGDDWEFESAARDSPEQLYTFWDDAVARSRTTVAAALTDRGLDQPIHQSTRDGRHPSLRRLLFDLIEEYGRHTGQADLIREAVDGRVGEDPPAGWAPESP